MKKGQLRSSIMGINSTTKEKNNVRIGVQIVVDKDLKDKIVGAKRIGDRLTVLRGKYNTYY